MGTSENNAGPGTVTLVASVFHTQPWFVMPLQMTCHQPYLLPKRELCLTLLNKEEKQPLKKMKLGVFKGIFEKE